MRRNPALTCLMALAALAPVMSSAQLDPNRTMVVVNGEKVTGGQYYRRMETLSGVGRMAGNRFVPAAPGYLTLQQLINERILISLARERGVLATDAEVDAEVQDRIKINPSYLENLRGFGYSLADVREDIRVELSEFKLQTMGINITDQQDDQFYRDNVRSYTVPTRYRLRMIVVARAADKATVDAEITGGKAFAEVARTRSVHWSRLDGGLLGDLSEEELGESVRDLVKGMKKGGLSPWLTSAEGQETRLFLEEITPGRVLPLDAQLRKGIRQRMMLDRGRVRNNMDQMMAEARRKARIEWQGTPFDADLRRVFAAGG